VAFYILCANTDLDGSEVQGVLFDTWLPHNEQTQVFYQSVHHRGYRATRALASSINPEVLYINGIYSWYYNFLPLMFSKAGRNIVACRGMLHPGALSQKPIKKKVYLQAWRVFGLHRSTIFHAVDGTEQAFTRQVFGQATQVIIAANLPRTFGFQQATKVVGRLKLLSVAIISAMKNYLEVINALADCTEQIEYTIYGPVKDAAYWERCLQQATALPPNITLNYKGELFTNAIEAALTGQEVFILPSKSENFGHAIYEALSAGKPVITSHHTPWNQLKAAKAGINVEVLNSASLSDAIRFFADMNAGDFAEWNKGARQYAINSLDFAGTIAQYDRLFAIPGQAIDVKGEELTG